jgi:futalosine hydrolase
MEIAPVTAALRRDPARGPSAYRAGTHELDVLVTGVGMVATAAWCARTLARTPCDLALNVGVCGSFDPSLAPGAVVHVVTDGLPELGAEDGDSFLSLTELKLLDPDAFPFRDGRLVNQAPPESAALGALAPVAGITVNTVHGNERTIEAVRQRVDPQTESMEGAAFMYACLVSGVPFAQVRGVSNRVERRNRSAWRIEDAVRNLGAAALAVLESL